MKALIFVSFILCIHVEGSSAYNMTEGRSLRSDYEYDADSGFWWKFHPVPATWHNARLRCYYEGAILASPLNENLIKVMRKLVAEQRKNIFFDEIFTGIHSSFSNGDYTSIEGLSLETKLFLDHTCKYVPLHKISARADSYNSYADCTLFDQNGRLKCSDCSNKFPYMCYKRAPEDLRKSTTICGTVDQEYEYSPRTGSCYKFHRIGRTWSRAFMTCLAEGGHLVIVNSDVEAQVIVEIFQKYHDESIMATYTYTASAGFQDWGERGSWWTIHGQDLSEAGYDKREEGSPDSGNNMLRVCGSINRSGKLNNIRCDGEQHTFPAICEIDPTPPDQLAVGESTELIDQF